MADVASFVGFNTYITSYKVKDADSLTVNGNKKQGYGAVELFNLPVGFPSQTAIQWQAPPVMQLPQFQIQAANTSPIPSRIMCSYRSFCSS
jgi:hypothetical protein